MTATYLQSRSTRVASEVDEARIRRAQTMRDGSGEETDGSGEVDDGSGEDEARSRVRVRD